MQYNGKYVHSLHLYIHTLYLYLHLKYITVHRTISETTVQLYLRTVYILGEQYTVHTRLTVHSTRMKIQMHSTLLFIQYWFTVYNGVLVHYIYVAFRYKTQVPCTLGENWIHYCYYLLTLHNISLLQLLFAYSCSSQYCVTARGCLSVCEVVYPSRRLSGCREGKEEREEGRGEGGKYFSAEIRNLSLPTLYCTHTV